MDEATFERASAARRDGVGSIVVGVGLALLAALAWDKAWFPFNHLFAVLVAIAAAYALVDGLQQVRAAGRLEEWAEEETPRVLPPAPPCPACGQRTEAGARYCPSCGEALPAAPSDAP